MLNIICKMRTIYNLFYCPEDYVRFIGHIYYSHLTKVELIDSK